MAAFVLSLREGLEAALIIGILLSALRRSMAGTRPVWLGVGLAVLASAVFAAGLSWLGLTLSGPREAIFEGITLVGAAIILVWMIFWMQEHSRGLRSHLTGEVERATGLGTAGMGEANAVRWGLVSVAFLAVLREGLELALFLAAALFATSAAQTVAGALIGLAVAAGLGALLFAGTVRLSLPRFFQVTSLLLILFAAGMAARGAHELVEAGLLPGLIDPIWNSAHILSEGSPLGQLVVALFGYSSDPSLTELLAYVGFLVIVGLGLAWRRARAAQWRHTPA